MLLHKWMFLVFSNYTNGELNLQCKYVWYIKVYRCEIETACRFRRLRLGKYVSFRNWAVFWLKKK